MDELAEKAALKQRFSRAEQALIAALNGMGRAVASQDEVVHLRRELLRALHDCETAGVAVETLEEFARRREAEDRATVREFAAQAMSVVPLLPRPWRQRISGTAGLLVVLLLLSNGAGAWWALAGGLCVWALVDVACLQMLPTPAVRVARRACAAHVDVRDLWPEGSSEQKDYLEGYRLHMQRLRSRGEGPHWIKVR